MKFTEHARVESVTKAVITLTMPGVSLAKLDFRSVLKLAEEFAEERAAKHKSNNQRLRIASGGSRSRKRSRGRSHSLVPPPAIPRVSRQVGSGDRAVSAQAPVR